MTDQDDNLAALYALGSLDPEAYAVAARRAETDPAFAAEVAAWERRLAPLAGMMPTGAPSDDLLARIEARLDASVDPASRTIRTDEGRWRDFAPGIRMKILSFDRERNRQTVLLDVQPGATLEGHPHDDDEELFMISGDLTVGNVTLYPGDYHHSKKGSRHPNALTRNGCRCLISMAAA